MNARVDIRLLPDKCGLIAVDSIKGLLFRSLASMQIDLLSTFRVSLVNLHIIRV